VICDDAKTAPAYFSVLRSHVKETCTLKVSPAPRHGATPNEVIEYGAAHVTIISDPDSATTVWAVIDLEMVPDSKKLSDALRERAKIRSVELALSQPCFEIWTLAHFVETGKFFGKCEAVIREIKKRWKSAFAETFPEKKAQADYRKVIDRIDTAIQNAKKHNSAKSQSWTEVWQVVASIMNYNGK
jgi:hypothetical protein